MEEYNLPKQNQSRIPRKHLQDNKDNFEKLMNSRSFYFLGSEIYGGVGGLYDWGPPGCAIRTNVQQLWREHFILEDDMLEISTTCITPESVFKHSGHIKKFADLVVRDVVNRRPERADKYLANFLTKMLENAQTQQPPLTEEKLQRVKDVLINAETYSGEELAKIYQEFQIKSIDGNDFSEPEPFNLMFKVEIGPGGGQIGYLRPETAQGMFVNFNRLQNYNSGKMPFASAQLGLGFRNEIAPRNQLIRVREFDMAEIEHFYDPEQPNHPKFKKYADLELPLLSSDAQVNEKSETPVFVKLGEAVKSGLISKETMAYFLARTYLFLLRVGVNAGNIRFRQHMPKEMAHYANDCWDAEIETSANEWVECVGHADRSAFDLHCHEKGSGNAMVATRRLQEPKVVKQLELTFDRGLLGKDIQRKQEAYIYYQQLSEQQIQELKTELEQSKTKEVKFTYKKDIKDKKTGLVTGQQDKEGKQTFDLLLLEDIELHGKYYDIMQATFNEYITTMSDEQNRELVAQLKANDSYKLQISQDFYIQVPKNIIKKTKEVESKIVEEKFVPHVIEPAFGLGRIITAILEHNYHIRAPAAEEKVEEVVQEDKKQKKGKKDAKEAKGESIKPVRGFLNLPARVAPIKCSILPLLSKEIFVDTTQDIKKKLILKGISCKIDDGGSAVGKRYARTDELGIPYGITVDFLTLEEGELKGTVTLREILTCVQCRIPVSEVIEVVSQLSEGSLTWEAVMAKYPKYETKVEEE